MKTALLLIAHGSRREKANDDLRFAAEQLLHRGGFDIVEPAFLELAEPSIPDAAHRCVGQGARRVVMLPYFLAAGVHVTRDLRQYRDEFTTRFYPEVEFVLAEPLGRHPLLLEVIAARAREALGVEPPPAADPAC
jgi:sirohydrochlorin ferrochelatase